MKKFLELLSSDSELSKKLANASREALIAAAKQLGIALTDADFSATSEVEARSDDELASVAGGKTCFCAIGGQGRTRN